LAREVTLIYGGEERARKVLRGSRGPYGKQARAGGNSGGPELLRSTSPPGPLRAGPADGASSAAVVTTNPAETGNPTADREDDADALPPTAPGGGVAEMGNGMSSLTRVTVPGQMLRCGFQAIRGALQARQRLPG